MNFDELVALVGRRALVFASALLASLAVITVATLALPKVYEATAILIAGSNSDRAEDTLDTTQSEQLSRTYSTLAASPGIAEEVAAQLGLDRDELLSRMSFAPVERTQLVQVTAEGETPEEAAEFANSYATVFTERSAEHGAASGTTNRVSVIEPAVAPIEASSPNVPVYLAFGALLSFMLALGAALVRDRLDRGLRIEPDAETVLDRPIIGRIPRANLGPALSSAELPIEITDQIRVLRTNVELSPGTPIKSFLVTSSSVGEGKSTIAAQFAAAIAADGDRVALVEGDIRRPALDLSALGSGFAPKRTGLVLYLAGKVAADAVISRDQEFPNLSVVYAGSGPEEPGRLLRSVRLPQLLDRLSRDHEWVIVDGPPVPAGDDALVLLSQVDAAVVVVDALKTSLPNLRAALSQLDKVDARVPGVAVNEVVPNRRLSDYYHATGSGARAAREGEQRRGDAREAAARRRSSGEGTARQRVASRGDARASAPRPGDAGPSDPQPVEPRQPNARPRDSRHGLPGQGDPRPENGRPEDEAPSESVRFGP